MTDTTAEIIHPGRISSISGSEGFRSLAVRTL